MLSSEDRAVLGMNPEKKKFRRPTAVSQVLRAITDDLARGPAKWDLRDKDANHPGHTMLVASDVATRRRAYALAHRIYHGCGYASEEQGLIVSPHDANPNTLTLLAVDEEGRDAATITLVFDSPAALPCDEIYGEELNTLRTQGRRLVEVTRLAVDEEHQRSRMLLVRLFNFIYIFARRVKGFDDFVIEVNPRHVNYYRRLLCFDQVGPERPCPRVHGAPAVLLRLDLAVSEREIRRVGGQGAAITDRTLYPHFYTWLEEGAVAEFLARGHKPMTAKEAQSFGLNQNESFQRQPLAAAGN